MDQDPLDLVMRGKGSPEDQLLEEIKEVNRFSLTLFTTNCVT